MVLAVAALWGLARLRFPDRPAPAPVPPVLAPFIPSSPLDAIAGIVRQVESKVLTGVVSVAAASGREGAQRPGAIAFRFGDQAAVGIPPQASAFDRNRDTATGVAIYTVSPATPPSLPRWQPRPTGGFFLAADPAAGGAALRPVFIGDLEPLVTPIWPEGVWAVPRDVELAVGTLLFTPEAAWAGAVSRASGRTIIVPPDNLLTVAGDLSARGNPTPGTLGIDVQPLSPALGRALNADRGVVVTAVDRAGPGARYLAVTDVIEQVNGHTIDSWDAWLLFTGRIHAGDRIGLTVRKNSGPSAGRQTGTTGSTDETSSSHAIELIATAPPTPRGDLGLTLRTGAAGLTEVVRVDPASPSGEAGLRVGDLLTRIGEVQRPSPQQARQVLNETGDSRPIVITLERSGRTIVLALEKAK